MHCGCGRSPGLIDTRPMISKTSSFCLFSSCYVVLTAGRTSSYMPRSGFRGSRRSNSKGPSSPWMPRQDKKTSRRRSRRWWRLYVLAIKHNHPTLHKAMSEHFDQVHEEGRIKGGGRYHHTFHAKRGRSYLSRLPVRVKKFASAV